MTWLTTQSRDVLWTWYATWCNTKMRMALHEAIRIPPNHQWKWFEYTEMYRFNDFQLPHRWLVDTLTHCPLTQLDDGETYPCTEACAVYHDIARVLPRKWYVIDEHRLTCPWLWNDSKVGVAHIPSWDCLTEPIPSVTTIKVHTHQLRPEPPSFDWPTLTTLQWIHEFGIEVVCSLDRFPRLQTLIFAGKLRFVGTATALHTLVIRDFAWWDSTSELPALTTLRFEHWYAVLHTPLLVTYQSQVEQLEFGNIMVGAPPMIWFPALRRLVVNDDYAWLERFCAHQKQPIEIINS